jgi:hypothetical protein
MKDKGLAIIGTYFKYLKDAKKKQAEKNKIWKRDWVDDAFEVLQIDNGYLVVSKRQLEAIR